MPIAPYVRPSGIVGSMKQLLPCVLGLVAGCWADAKDPAKPTTTGAFPRSYPGMRRVATEIGDLGPKLDGAVACEGLAAILATGSPEERQLEAAPAERAALSDAVVAEWQAAHAAELDSWATGFIPAIRQQTCDVNDRKWPLVKAAFVAIAQPKEPPPFVAHRRATYDELLVKIPKATDCDALMKEVAAKGKALEAELFALPPHIRLVDDLVWEEDIEKMMETRAKRDRRPVCGAVPAVATTGTSSACRCRSCPSGRPARPT